MPAHRAALLLAMVALCGVRRAASQPSEDVERTTCTTWKRYLNMDNTAGKVSISCALMGAKPPCQACAAMSLDCEYLWLGEMTSLDACEAAATRPLKNAQNEPLKDGKGRVAICEAVTYHETTATGNAKQCYCSTSTATDKWIAPEHKADGVDTAACVREDPLPGFIFAGVVLVSAMVLPAGAVVYGVKVKGASFGKDALGESGLGKGLLSLPGLVVDGVAFTRSRVMSGATKRDYDAVGVAKVDET